MGKSFKRNVLSGMVKTEEPPKKQPEQPTPDIPQAPSNPDPSRSDHSDLSGDDDWRTDPNVTPPETDEAKYGWLWDKGSKQWRPRKSAAGRKQVKGAVHTTNIDIPLDLYDKTQRYGIGGNMTAYIIKLIKEDLEENEADYEQLAALQAKFKK